MKIDSAKYAGAYGYDFVLLGFDNRNKMLKTISKGTGEY
jgi:hypothetical protein